MRVKHYTSCYIGSGTQASLFCLFTGMFTFNTDATIDRDGELHLDHLPFHTGEKVKVILYTPNGKDEHDSRSEYEAFMKEYAAEDSVYDSL